MTDITDLSPSLVEIPQEEQAGAILDYTMAMRQRLVERTMSEIEASDKPVAAVKLAALNGVLDSMDKQVQTKQKLEIEADKVNNDDEIKQLLIGLANRPEMSLQAIQARQEGGEVIDGEYTAVIPDYLPPPELVPGHTEVNAAQLDYSTIMENNAD